MIETQQVETARSVYRYRIWQRIIFAFFGSFFGLAALITGLDLLVVPAGARSEFLLALLLLAFPAAFLLSMAFRACLLLEGSRIELRGAFLKRAAERSEVEGFRIRGARFGTYRQIVLKRGGRPISIHSGFNTDARFQAWMEGLPDLNQRDRETLLTTIEQKVELGANKEDRLAALTRARRLNTAAMVAGIAAAIGFNFGSRPWVELSGGLLFLAPFATAWLCWRQPLLYGMFKRRKDPRAETSHGLLVSGFGLLFHMQQFNFLSLKPLLIGMAVVGLATAAAYFEPALSGGGKRALFAMLMTAALYSYGAVTMTDACFDGSRAARYSASVVNQHITHGRATTYYLQLAPWGPVATARYVKVTRQLYEATGIGDTVCLDLHRGWLRVPWFRVSACSASRLH